MGRDLIPLEGLGRRIAERQDQQLEAGDTLARARQRLLAADEGSGRGRRLFYVLCAAAVAIVAVVALRFASPAPLTYTVGTAASAGVLHAALEVPADGELPLLFSDGTSVLLRGGTRARVAELTPQGARIDVERGRAVVSVTPRSGARWQLGVGPFEVVVVGTRFDVSWDETTLVFSLDVHHGSVLVSGPNLAERPVVAGERLRIETAPESARLDEAPTAAPVEEAAPSAEPTAPSASSRPAAPSWKELAARGSWREAFDAAEAAGFDAIVAGASASELLQLGDVARYAGRSDRARFAYEALRQRYGGTAQAATAAFALGRMSSGSGAIQWFQAYLAEAPAGPLAREALGRILEAQNASGSADARTTASQYLARYPNGPHAELARKVLGP
jgi:transmembrane sensor